MRTNTSLLPKHKGGLLTSNQNQPPTVKSKSMCNEDNSNLFNNDRNNQNS